MGTVLSFSPREGRPIYASQQHRGSTTMSTSSSVDFPLNNYAYEQLNNVKNRENTNYNSNNTSINNNNISINNNGNNLSLYENSTSNIMSINNNINNNNHTDNDSSAQDRQNDNVRILSEKNAIEKNLKKHSLFINALSWKRLSSHGKKKIENSNCNNSNKTKTGNLTAASFRPASLTDTIHPLVVDKNTNYHQQQIQFPNNINNNNNSNNQAQNIYYTPNGPKSLLALDLVRSAGNQNPNTLQQQHIDKLGPKLPIQLTLPLQPANLHHQQPPPQPMHHPHSQITHQNSHHGPRKTVIQVSRKFSVFFVRHLLVLPG